MILGTKDVTEMLKNASELEISKAISKGIKLVQSAARAECPVVTANCGEVFSPW